MAAIGPNEGVEKAFRGSLKESSSSESSEAFSDIKTLSNKILFQELKDEITDFQILDAKYPEITESIIKINQTAIGILAKDISVQEVKESFKNAFKNLKTSFEKVKVYEGRLELKVKLAESYNFKIYAYPMDSEKSKIQVLFNEKISDLVGSGAFKTVVKAYQIEGKKIDPLVKAKTTFEKGDKTEEEVMREQYVLNVCHNKDLKGTPKTFLITNKAGKQVILQSLIEGGTFDKAQNLSVNEKIKIYYELAVALSGLHRAGISHNDLKGGNILLDKDNHPVIIDFGGATWKSGQEPIGTISYLPPEILPPEKFESLVHVKWEIDCCIEFLTEEFYAFMEHIEIPDDSLTKFYEILSVKTSNIGNLSEFKDEKRLQLNEETKKLLSSLGITYKNKDKALEGISRYRILASQQTELENNEAAIRASINELIKKNTKENWVPQKNDSYALGLLGQELFGENASEEVQKAILGLLQENPHERFTAEEAASVISQALSDETAEAN